MTLDNLLSGLNQASSLIYENNKAKGFWDKERNIGELLMLIVSELGEAMEAHRKSKTANTEHYDNLINDGYTWDDSPVSFDAHFKEGIKDTFEDEIADTIIRLLDLCGAKGLDIEKHILAKVNYNKTRPHLHGKKY